MGCSQFSVPFAWTVMSALLLEDNMPKLATVDELKKLKIGAVNGTTTRGILNNAYSSIHKEIVGLKDNEDGMHKFKSGGNKDAIDIYFNDEIILLNFLKELNQEAGKEKYSIRPSNIGFEEYGLIVYRTNKAGNADLLSKINYFLQQESEIKDIENTKLKILNNDDFKKFFNDDLMPLRRNKWKPIFTVLLVVIIIAPVGIFLCFRKNKGKTKTNQSLNLSENYIPFEEPAKYDSSIPQVHVNFHNITQSNSTRDMTNNNFDQRNPGIMNVGNQGTNEGSITQQINQNRFTSEQKQDLGKFAKDIQSILEKLEKNNPNTTQNEKQNIVSYEIPREQRSRIVRALKAGGEEALKEVLDNPYLNVAIAIVKEWQNEEYK
ncbi:substrate-binding periplasmic protein [Brunnivagina elsteri]|uniref:Uncharacterized protein n=1 Tax=Brunnivagina elsteri CCALA 953 TaxID=987040 RepID=A0A2A2TP38_9CYAN|nr:transporter substrate-binding domain-containing protein [Calothrix elsteri]PAX60124.1 hypothetical protein CK510_03350 [Calothrix elsteri CCALA 953]